MSQEERTVKCFVCRKDLPMDKDGSVQDAGYAVLSFHYGSRHDQLGVQSIPQETKLDIILGADKIEAYVCDDCFEERHDLVDAYIVRTVTRETNVFSYPK